MTALLTRLSADHAARTASAQADYLGLVRGTTAGEDISPEQAEDILDRASKSVADLEAACKALQRRIDLRLALDAIPVQSQQRQDLQARLDALTCDYEQATSRYQVAAQAIRAEIADLDARTPQRSTIEGELVRGCPDAAMQLQHAALIDQRILAHRARAEAAAEARSWRGRAAEALRGPGASEQAQCLAHAARQDTLAASSAAEMAEVERQLDELRARMIAM